MELLISGIVIIDVGPFDTDQTTGDLHNARGTFSKHVLDAGGAWRKEVIADNAMPSDFALGAYTIDASNVFSRVPPPPAPPPEVPESILPRKAFKYMKRTQWQPGTSIYQHILNCINAIPDAQTSSDAMDDFTRSQEFDRHSPQTLQIAALAGFTSEQMDTFWIEADKLP